MLSTEIARRFREIDKLTPEQEDRIEINDRPLIASEVIADAGSNRKSWLVM